MQLADQVPPLPFTRAQAFERRGWSRCTSDRERERDPPLDGVTGAQWSPAGDWNVYWASVGSAKALFDPQLGFRLSDFQLVNHFPNSHELTRKDLMVKNCRRYRRTVQEQQGTGGRAAMELMLNTAPEELDFLPVTFLLPADYSLFVEEYKRNPAATWIMKPTARARGVGIFLVNRLSQIKRWAAQLGIDTSRGSANALAGRDSYVCSRYIDEPLLIGSKKFDLRIYVCVTSFRPLRAYWCNLGFARFTAVKYSNDQLDNPNIHLTNVSIQKHCQEYNENHGNKWSMADFFLFIEGTRGLHAVQTLKHAMKMIVVHSLRACQPVVVQDKHCFELFGFDLLVDAQLKPWLIEVNASPALSCTTDGDRLLKNQVVDDTLEVVAASRATILQAPDITAPTRVGSFELLFDEHADYANAGVRSERNAEAAAEFGVMLSAR